MAGDVVGLLDRAQHLDAARVVARAGGAYLFGSRADAERYLRMHRERLAGWGIVEPDVTVREVNAALSALAGAAAATALGVLAAVPA